MDREFSIVACLSFGGYLLFSGCWKGGRASKGSDCDGDKAAASMEKVVDCNKREEIARGSR